MKISAKFVMGALALGLLIWPAVGRAQDRQEHRARNLEDLPSPMEALRNVQNTGRMLFVLADQNHDGQVSQQEAVDAANLLVGGFFFRADADGNGVVTEQEARSAADRYLDQNPWLKYVVQSFEAQIRQKTQQQGGSQGGAPLNLLVLIDSNNDKQIQAAELRQFVQTMTQTVFGAADTNRDGQISPSEVNAAVAGGARAVVQQGFRQADSDNSGQLSRAEFDKALVEPANVVFQIADLNHDGQLSPQEVQQIGRALVQQLRAMQLPEPPNSPTNLIESGRLPREAAPVPNFPTGSTNTNANPAQPVAPR
jgi:Ca2+-binding EF-hand superfamily protein